MVRPCWAFPELPKVRWFSQLPPEQQLNHLNQLHCLSLPGQASSGYSHSTMPPKGQLADPTYSDEFCTQNTKDDIRKKKIMPWKGAHGRYNSKERRATIDERERGRRKREKTTRQKPAATYAIIFVSLCSSKHKDAETENRHTSKRLLSAETRVIENGSIKREDPTKPSSSNFQQRNQLIDTVDQLTHAHAWAAAYRVPFFLAFITGRRSGSSTVRAPHHMKTRHTSTFPDRWKIMSKYMYYIIIT